MREPKCCREIRARLSRRGIPRLRVDRIVGELTDHWHDLQRTALERGMGMAEASAEANQKLGNPGQLESRVLEQFKRSSWMGRHPILTIVWMPLLLVPALMATVLLPLFWLGERLLGGSIAALDGVQLARAVVGLYWILSLATAVWLCWRAWWKGLGTRWVLALCSYGALMTLLRDLSADGARRNISLSVHFPWPLGERTLMVLAFHSALALVFLIAAHRTPRNPNRSTSNSPSLPS